MTKGDGDEDRWIEVEGWFACHLRFRAIVEPAETGKPPSHNAAAMPVRTTAGRLVSLLGRLTTQVPVFRRQTVLRKAEAGGGVYAATYWSTLCYPHPTWTPMIGPEARSIAWVECPAP